MSKKTPEQISLRDFISKTAECVLSELLKFGMLLALRKLFLQLIMKVVSLSWQIPLLVSASMRYDVDRSVEDTCINYVQY